jgi:uncharacterized protein
LRKTGDTVAKGEVVGLVSDPFGETETEVAATSGGLIIGRTNLPVVNQGDALFHIATVRARAAAGEAVDAMEQDVGNDPIFDEDEII